MTLDLKAVCLTTTTFMPTELKTEGGSPFSIGKLTWKKYF